MIGNYNFDAKSHREMYDKIHANDGASFAEAVDDAWNSFRAVMANAKAEIEAAYKEAGVEWLGAAGEAFSGAMAPLAQFAEDARAAGVETHHSVQAQQSYYQGAKNGMPPPVQVSSTANDDFFGIPAAMTHLVGGQTDQDVEEQRANEAKREAVRVMNTYQSGAASSVSSIGTFVPPPQVTAQVAEPTIQQPSDSQTQYSQQWNSKQRATRSTSDQSTPPQQQQQHVTQPPALPGNDDTTGTSNYQPPADTLPRPTPQPVPPPGLHPTPNPQPPISGPLPLTMRPPQGSTPVGGTSSRGSSGVSTPRLGSGVVGQQPGQLGRGPAAGVGGFGDTAQTGRGGQGTAAARGAAGSPGMGMAGAPQRGQGEEDKEHKAAPYLEELDDVWGEGTIPMVAPPVIGEDEQ